MRSQLRTLNESQMNRQHEILKACRIPFLLFAVECDVQIRGCRGELSNQGVRNMHEYLITKIRTETYPDKTVQDVGLFLPGQQI